MLYVLYAFRLLSDFFWPSSFPRFHTGRFPPPNPKPWELKDISTTSDYSGIQDISTTLEYNGIEDISTTSDYNGIEDISTTLDYNGIEDISTTTDYFSIDNIVTTRRPLIFTTAAGKELALRLVDDKGKVAHSSGRVEVFHSGKWGTICDDYIEYHEQLEAVGTVICRQLGFDGGIAKRSMWLKGFAVADSSIPIWLTRLHCRGNEDKLQHCRHGLVNELIGCTDHREDIYADCS